MSPKQRWRIHVLTLILPLTIPLLAGGYWLWLNHLLIWWLGASTVVALIWWGISQFLKKHRPEPKWLDISQAIIWTQQSEDAWKKVEAISADERNTNPDLSASDFYLQTLTRVMNAVAEVYYPRQEQAILEIKIPYLLKVIEILAQELRINFTENVPGSHIFSINDLAKGHKIASKGREVYRLFRIVSAGIDPVSAIIRELKIFTTANLLAESTDDLKCWLIDAYIKKIGYYAIELYSGNLTLDDDAFSTPTRQTQREIKKIQQREKTLNAEPFRVLVLGQTNAGKASLINAIADRQVAIADAMPNPLNRQTYLLRRDDFPSTMIADCQRYNDTQCQKERSALLKQASKSDVIIIVVSAINPAYQIDKIILDDIKQLNNNPRIIVALTQIDKIRPLREWNPPYNLAIPCSAKAEVIKNNIASISNQLNIGIDQIVPLSLRQGMIYNCQEQLIPALLQQFKHAEGKRHLRSLQAYQHELKRNKLWTQLFNAGNWVTKTGFGLLSKQNQKLKLQTKTAS